MTKPEAEQIASAMTMIRPDWLRVSLLTLLAKHQHRPARDVMLALVWVAYDPDTQAPGRINADGPWWQAGRLAATETDARPAYLTAARCGRHGDTEPCLHCQREDRGPVADLDTIRRLRAEARTQHTEGDPA